MKPDSVLFLVPDLLGSSGGIARHSRTVCQALVESGVKVTVVALHDDTACEDGESATFPPLVYALCRGSRARFILRSLAAAWTRPDMVMVAHPNFSALGVMVARLSDAPLVVFGHGIDIWEPLPVPARSALRKADRVICVSRVTADRAMGSNGLTAKQTRVLHHCLPPGFTPRDESPVEDSHLSLLTVARVSASERYKGHSEVIRVLSALLQTFPELKYDVVGDGDDRPRLELIAASEGVAHAVQFHGAVSEEDLRNRYAAASVFVMPSTGEGFGLVFLEAMAFGKPVVAGNQDATPEVVRDGETGLLVDPANQAALESAIRRVLADAGLRQRMGHRGREVVMAHFSYETYRAQLLSHLGDVLDQRVRGARLPTRASGR